MVWLQGVMGHPLARALPDSIHRAPQLLSDPLVITVLLMAQPPNSKDETKSSSEPSKSEGYKAPSPNKSEIERPISMVKLSHNVHATWEAGAYKKVGRSWDWENPLHCNLLDNLKKVDADARS